MIPSSSANVNVGGSNTPLRQIAWFTVGATGVTSSQDVPVNVTTNVAVSGVDPRPRVAIVPHFKPSDNVAVTVTV